MVSIEQIVAERETVRILIYDRLEAINKTQDNYVKLENARNLVDLYDIYTRLGAEYSAISMNELEKGNKIFSDIQITLEKMME